MPARDSTGPLGAGPLTGRGLGPCGRGLAFRRGLGRGFGRGFGYRYWESAPAELTKDEKLKILKAEKEDIEKALRELED